MGLAQQSHIETLKRKLFLKIFYVVWVIISCYAALFYYLDIKMAAYSTLIGALVLSPITYILILKNYWVSARVLFLISSNLYIFFGTISTGNLVSSEYYYLPASFLSFLIFSEINKYAMLLLTSTSFVFWFATVKLNHGFLDEYKTIVDIPKEFLTDLSFFGSYSLVLLFVWFFMRMNKEYLNMIEAEREISVQSSKLATIGEMTTVILHEINNPVAIIDANIQMIKKYGDVGEKSLAKFDGIQRSIVRIQKIISGLKKFSRKSNVGEKEDKALSEIIKDVQEITDLNCKKFNVNLRLKLNADIVLKCNAIQIEQVFVNLINNSIDAIKDKNEKWIEITSISSATSLIIRVTDSGNGIPKNIEDKLFEPFFTSKPAGVGTGLGLSISRSILEEHGATIEINREFHNTCFEIRFLGAFKNSDVA